MFSCIERYGDGLSKCMMMSCLSTHGEASNERNERKKNNAKHSKAESVVFVSSSKKVAQTFLIRTLSPLT